MNTSGEIVQLLYDYPDNFTFSNEDFLSNGTSNFTEPAVPVDNHADFHDAFMKYYYHIMSILLLFGFPLNIFHFVVLIQKELRFSIVFRMMTAIALFDFWTHIITFLVFAPFWIRPPLTEEEECFSTQNYFDVMLDWIAVPILDIIQRSSSWMALFMALFRTLSVMFPLSSRMQSLAKPHVVFYAFALSLFLSSTTSLPVFLQIRVYVNTTEETCNGTVFELSEPRYTRRVPVEYRPYYRIAVTFYGFFKALPSLFDLILAILLVSELVKAKKRRNNLKKEENEQFDSTTKLIAFMTFSFFILEVPNGIGHIVFGLFEPKGTALQILQLFLDVAEIFPVLNCASHVFVCFLLTTQYRDTLRTVLRIPIKVSTVTVVGKTSAGSNS